MSPQPVALPENRPYPGVHAQQASAFMHTNGTTLSYQPSQQQIGTPMELPPDTIHPAVSYANGGGGVQAVPMPMPMPLVAQPQPVDPLSTRRSYRMRRMPRKFLLRIIARPSNDVSMVSTTFQCVKQRRRYALCQC